MSILINIVLYAALFLAAVLVIGALITFIVERSPYQAQFVAGQIPSQPPAGFCPGTAHVLLDKQTPWLGKSFDPRTQIGFNIFTPTGARILKTATPSYSRFDLNTDATTNAYYFKTYVGKGIKDTETDVIKLDYSASENPWIIRIILDEIVAIGPNEYLGKIHVKFLPGFFVTIGYFGLKN